MSDELKTLSNGARKWFAEANRLLEERGAPSMGGFDTHAQFVEKTEVGVCIIVNVSNAFVLCFHAPRTSNKEVEVMLSVNQGPEGLGSHKAAVLTNVLTSVEVRGFMRMCIGSPFKITEEGMVCVEDIG